MSGQSISPSVSMTRLDVFKETSQQFPAMFVATEVDILNQNMLCTSLCPAGLWAPPHHAAWNLKFSLKNVKL